MSQLGGGYQFVNGQRMATPGARGGQALGGNIAGTMGGAPAGGVGRTVGMPFQGMGGFTQPGQIDQYDQFSGGSGLSGYGQMPAPNSPITKNTADPMQGMSQGNPWTGAGPANAGAVLNQQWGQNGIGGNNLGSAASGTNLSGQPVYNGMAGGVPVSNNNFFNPNSAGAQASNQSWMNSPNNPNGPNFQSASQAMGTGGTGPNASNTIGMFGNAAGPGQNGAPLSAPAQQSQAQQTQSAPSMSVQQNPSFGGQFVGGGYRTINGQTMATPGAAGGSTPWWQNQQTSGAGSAPWWQNQGASGPFKV